MSEWNSARENYSKSLASNLIANFNDTEQNAEIKENDNSMIPIYSHKASEG